MALLVAAAPFSASPASSLESGVASGGGTAVTTGTWGLIPTSLATGTAPVGALTLSFANVVLPVSQYFYVFNSGTEPLTAGSYSMAVSTGGVLGTDPSITLTACQGGSWNVLLGTCSATTTVIGTYTPATTAAASSSAVPSAPGDRVEVQASMQNGGLLGNTTAIVSTTVSAENPRQLRAPITSEQ